MLAFSPSWVFAISIKYKLTNLGGNRYQYAYTVTNDGSLGRNVQIRVFDLLFDTVLYNESTLVISTATPLRNNWDETIFLPVPGDPTTYDAFSTGSGISVGQSIKAFTIEFDWLGLGKPTTQPFEIYDPVTFDLLEQGTTTLDLSAQSIPTLSKWALLFLALALFVLSNQYRKSTQIRKIL